MNRALSTTLGVAFTTCAVGCAMLGGNRHTTITLSVPARATPDSACAHDALHDASQVVAVEANLGIPAGGQRDPVFSVRMDPVVWRAVDFTVRYTRPDPPSLSDSLIATAWWLGGTRSPREEWQAETAAYLLLDAVIRQCLPEITAPASCTYRSGGQVQRCPSRRTP